MPNINIKDIKKDIELHLGENVEITINGSRNRVEKYTATIKDIFSFVFVVETHEDNNVKSFSYTDVLTQNVCINYI